MSLESDIDLLGGVDLFAGLSRDQLRLLAFGAEHRSLRSGEFLFRADARADAGFVIVEGLVELARTAGGGARRSIARAGPGTLLGEMALIAETHRGADAVTLTDCEVIRITRPLFRRMLQEFPQIAAVLQERIRGELVALTERIAALEGRFADE